MEAWCSIRFGYAESNPLYSRNARLFSSEDTEITHLKIPDGVKKLNKFAFTGCKGVESADLNQVETIESNAFAVSELKSVETSACLREIGTQAFFICKNLATVRLSSSAITFSSRAFSDCPSIKDVYYDTQTVPVIPTNVAKTLFGDLPPLKNATLHVPEHLVDKFQETQPWSNFAYIVSLDTQENPNDIQSTHNRSSFSPLYDLQGRKLEQAPRKGMYLQGGKKWMK